VIDAAPLTLGVEVKGTMMEPIIVRGTPIPVKKSMTFSTYSHNQTTVMIKVFEGERQFTKDNNLLGQFTLDDIPPMPRGAPQIEISYDLDANGILNVSAVEKSTGKLNKITITNEKGRLSKEDVERMVKDAEKFREEDERLRQLVDAKNDLESYIAGWNNTLSEEKIKEKLSPEEMESVRTKLDEASKWLEENSSSEAKDEFVAKLKELEAVINPLASKMYADPSAQGGMPGMPGGANPFAGMDPEQMEKMMEQLKGMQGMPGMPGMPEQEEDDEQELDEDNSVPPKPTIEEID
jgi:L1 cell adhesion molecule like protein